MPAIVIGNTPQSELGKQALSIVHDIVLRYLQLDIAEIQQFCEAERIRKLAEWTVLTTQDVLELNLPRIKAIDEATPAFDLYMPTNVTIIIEEERDSYATESDGTPKRAAQTTAPNEATKEAFLTTFTKWVTTYLGEMWIVDPTNGRPMMPLKLSTVHELAHASGDYPPRIPVPVNAVRGYISVIAIWRAVPIGVAFVVPCLVNGPFHESGST